MRHSSLSSDLNPQRSLRSARYAILRRLAIHQKLAPVIRLIRRVFIRHSRAQTVALFAHYEQQPNENSLLMQSLGRRNLRRDNSFRIARATSINALRIFRRSDERRNCIQVCGKNDLRIWLLRRCSVNVEALALDRYSPRLITNASKLPIKIVSDRSFITGDGFDVDELASKRDCIHEGRE